MARRVDDVRLEHRHVTDGGGRVEEEVREPLLAQLGLRALVHEALLALRELGQGVPRLVPPRQLPEVLHEVDLVGNGELEELQTDANLQHGLALLAHNYLSGASPLFGCKAQYKNIVAHNL